MTVPSCAEGGRRYRRQLHLRPHGRAVRASVEFVRGFGLSLITAGYRPATLEGPEMGSTFDEVVAACPDRSSAHCSARPADRGSGAAGFCESAVVQLWPYPQMVLK
ncbi:hypothetical protein Ait01nite_093500 [Actinoplanes italicus]|nr:hypothetical protein Ait01nite_093500 [Actinoplanes italicus]